MTGQPEDRLGHKSPAGQERGFGKFGLTRALTGGKAVEIVGERTQTAGDIGGLMGRDMSTGA